MTRRRGRESKPAYVTSWGETINGACLCPDGRLRPIGLSTPKFGPASDERMAVHRFRQWQILQGDSGSTAEEIRAGCGISYGPTGEGRDYWREYFRNLILSDPKQAAIELNVPHLADYPAKPEKPQYSLAELGQLYLDNARNDRGKPLNAKYRSNQKRWWSDFLKSLGVVNARDITSPLIQQYRDEVMREFDSGMSPDWVASRFKCVKTILSYGIECTEDKVELRRVADCCLILHSPRRLSNPKPISPTHFHALLAEASVADKACLLFGLNCLMHGGEVGKTLRSEVDLANGTVSQRRSKNGYPRVARLWPETIKAIEAYQAAFPHKSDFLFVSEDGTPLASETLRQRIVRIRDRVNKDKEEVVVPDYVTFEGIRDAGFTIGEEVDSHHVKFVAGHKTGMSDKYVLRSAENANVVKVCEAIRKAYFG